MTVLYHPAESVAHAAAKLAAQINLPSLTTLRLTDLHWGQLPDGHVIENSHPVFPRMVFEATP